MTETNEQDQVLEEVAGQTYRQQILQEYWQAGEQVTRNAMVMLCLTARRYDERVRFIILDDSDQGEWQYTVGLCSALPVEPGDYSTISDLDPAYEFDDDGWASSLDDRTSQLWSQFCVLSPSMPGWQFLGVDKVLAEVDLPWRPVPTRSTWAKDGD